MLVHEFSPKELERAKRRLTGQYLLSKPAFNQTPLGVLLGGQPASGKTRLFEYIQLVNSKIDFTTINGDEYRQYHPRAQEIEEEYGQDAPIYTQAFSNILVKYVKAECLRLRCNFIIEGTMRTYAVIERTTSELKKPVSGARLMCLPLLVRIACWAYFSGLKSINNEPVWDDSR